MRLIDGHAGLYAAVALFLAALAGGGSAVYLTDQRLEAAQQEFASRRSQLQDARQRLQASGQEKEVIARYLNDYRNLEKRGVIGPEKRIDWLDGLRVASQEARLFGVEYQIGAQQPYSAEGLALPPGLPLRRSPMTLTLKLLHEGELLRFFHALAAQDVGLFTVDKCTVERAAGGDVPQPRQPNLRAECVLSWITLQSGGTP